MRFDTNSRNSRRNDYEQFANFLGLNGSRNFSPSCVGTQNNAITNANNNVGTSQRNEKSLAMVYPVKQNWQNIYDPQIGLQKGTIFEELNLPFYQSGCNTKRGEGCQR
jgi:hypothetical protein